MTLFRKILLPILVCLVFWGIALQAAYMLLPTPRAGWDFATRMNEVKCLYTGVDPFDVWCGNVEKAPYYSMSKPARPEKGELFQVNAYPPWAYTYVMPLAILPVKTAWAIYFPLNILFLGALFVWGFKKGKAALGDTRRALFVASIPLLFLLPAIGSCFQSGNYPLPVLAATVALQVALDRKHDILAGIFWALAMIKPQIAILYAVPLLMQRKFLTCFVAAATCLIASIPASLLCGKNPLMLILEAVQGSAHGFMGCGTFPYFLCSLTGDGLGAVLGLILGVILTAFLTRKLETSHSNFVLLAPAMAISTLWTYAPLYNSVVMWPVFILLALLIVQLDNACVRVILFGAVGLFASRVYTFFHGVTMLFPEKLGYSYILHNHLDSLNSFFSLCVVVALFLLWRKQNCSQCYCKPQT